MLALHEKTPVSWSPQTLVAPLSCWQQEVPPVMNPFDAPVAVREPAAQ